MKRWTRAELWQFYMNCSLSQNFLKLIVQTQLNITSKPKKKCMNKIRVPVLQVENGTSFLSSFSQSWKT